MSWEDTYSKLEDEIQSALDIKYDEGYDAGISQSEREWEDEKEKLESEIEDLKSQLEELQEKYDVLEMELNDLKEEGE